MFLYSLDVRSGGPISKNQEAMDVKHYFLDLVVDPHKKSISGSSTIQFIINKDVPVLEIDLYKKLTVSGVSIDGTNLDFKHREHKVFVENPGIDLFSLHKLKIKYGGRPPIAKHPPWDGGLLGRGVKTEILGWVFLVKETVHIFGIHVRNTQAIKQTVPM